MQITVKNDYHDTQATLRTKDGRLSPRQVARVRRALCGYGLSCTCGGALKERGPQAVTIECDGRTVEVTA